MKRFEIRPDYYDEGVSIFKKDYVEFNTGLTVLIGCNGSGKTTLLNHIKYECEHSGIPVFKYDNYTEGGDHGMSRALFNEDYSRLASDFVSSEGERIYNNLAEMARNIGRFVTENMDKERFILLDAIDSGFSIDNVLDLKEGLFDAILNDGYSSTYIIVSANEYELASGERCFDVQNCEYIDIKSYDDYRKFIIKSREYKDSLYAKG